MSRKEYLLHPEVVMQCGCWLHDSLQDAASRCFLQLLGLFDRPMNAQ